MNSSNTYPKKKLVMILSRFPYPLEKGDKLRGFHQLKELSREFNITLITTSDTKISKEAIEIVRKYCVTIHIFKLNKLSIIFNVLFQFLTNKPFQIGYFYSSKINFQIQQILKSLEPDHIYCQLIRVSEYVKNYHGCSKTIDYMDALSKGIERRIEKAPFYTKWLFKSEAIRLANYERKIFEYFENHTIISEQDRELILHPNRKEIVCIPNGVDTSFFAKKTIKKEYDLVFVGNLSYSPNIEAINTIINEILPAYNNKYNTLKLLLSGATPAQSIIKQIQNNPNIELTGWVDDISDSYLKGKIFIAPMTIGTGLQNKLIEAMALGIPCITTSLANNALKAENNESIIVANNTAEMIDSIHTLLTNNTLYEKIAQNGKKFIVANFDWKIATSKLIELIHKK